MLLALSILVSMMSHHNECCICFRYVCKNIGKKRAVKKMLLRPFPDVPKLSTTVLFLSTGPVQPDRFSQRNPSEKMKQEPTSQGRSSMGRIGRPLQAFSWALLVATALWLGVPSRPESHGGRAGHHHRQPHACSCGACGSDAATLRAA